MPIITPPPFVQGGSHTSKQVRQFISAQAGQPVETFVNSVGAVGMAHGLARPGDLAVTQNGTPNMSVNVGIGRAFISGDSSLVQGAYIFTNDATTNVVIATADGSNGRRDLVCAQVRETIEDASTFNDARAFVVTGTPAAVPVDPAIPAGCLVLDRVVVGAGVTSITNANITRVVGLARASNWNQAWGVVPGGYQEATSDQGGVGAALTDRTGLTVTFTAITGRRYRTTVFTIVASSVAGDIAAVTIDRGGSQVQAGFIVAGLFGGAGDRSIVVPHVNSSSISGATTIKARFQRASGSGTITSSASAGAPSFILIEDIGPI